MKTRKAKVPSEKIIVYVNDKPKETFLGMCVRHVIGARAAQRVKTHHAIVRDADGNVVGIDGALFDGARLYVAPMDPKSFADEIQKRA
ncbi:MAG: hypothetical protein FJ009_04515 [Chloroflexi bacterium]|nr:hypothetical protein [Chloroflexota bacterium]